MASNMSRGWHEPELNDMSPGRTDDQATSGGKINHGDDQGLWPRELSHKRTRTLTTFDQTERIERLQGRPNRYARYTKKLGEILLAGQRFTRSVAAFCNSVLQDQEDLVMERDVATFLRKQGSRRLQAPRSITWA